MHTSTNNMNPRLCAAILFLLISTLFSHAQEEEKNPPTPPAQLENHLQAPPNPAVYPLTLLGGEALRSITIMDRELLPLSATLKNISDKPVKIISIRSNCSCLKVDKYNDISLKPGDTLPLKLSLDAKHLKKDDENDFEKRIIVMSEGFAPTYASIEGTVKNMFSFEPAQAIDLGEFIGDVSTWERTFHIKSLFPQEKLALKSPTDNRFFNLAITQTSPQDFQLKVTPRSPFPIFTIKEIIDLDVEGIPNYGPLQVVVLGTPKGLRFALLTDRKYVKKEKLQTDTPLEFDVPITLSSLLPQRPKHGLSRRKRASNNLIANLPVNDEEEKARPLDQPDSWRPFIKDISVKELPEGVSIELQPDVQGIKAHFTLQPQFLKNEEPAFRAVFLFRAQRFGIFHFKAK